MRFFINRYIINYIIFSTLLCISWFGSIWCFDGIIPSIIGLGVIMFMIFCIPFMVWQDYHKMLEIKKDYEKMKKDEITKETFCRNLALKISSELGVPDYMAEKAAHYLIKEKETPPPIV